MPPTPRYAFVSLFVLLTSQAKAKHTLLWLRRRRLRPCCRSKLVHFCLGGGGEVAGEQRRV